MYTTINFCNFADAFRSVRPDNFSYEGLTALFEYLEQLEEGTGEDIELDVIGLCSEYEELDIETIVGDETGCLMEPITAGDIPKDKEERRKFVVEYLRNRTEVIEIPKTDRVIIRSF